MLAGYLPFDDDPENPDGDNINQLYKYITTTPLTFPEYVTPHARDLLRRILVPDPRKRADLFEVARHSWLSDYAHVVSQVTSSTTTVGDIANATVDSGESLAGMALAAVRTDLEIENKITSGLVRSHSVREPTKPALPTTMSPAGGLSHQGKVEAAQLAERNEPPKDSKRRTVQVEYVAPSRQTARGEPLPKIGSPGTDGSGARSPPSTTKSRARAGTEAPQSTSRAYAATSKPLPADPRYPSEDTYYAQSDPKRNSQPAPTTQRDVAPSSRLPNNFPRSVSDSTSAFGQAPTSYARPATGGSMTSASGARLPSRGNSYSQPLAPTVAATNAQGRVTAPRSENRYNISGPMPASDSYGTQPGSRPSTQHYATPPTIPTQPTRAHKRSNTFGNFFRTGSISVPKQQPKQQTKPQAETPVKEKKYPPTSMKNPVTTENTPRQSTDSRRPSFNFSRKSRENTNDTKPEKTRRFSLLPASFSFKGLTSTASSKEGSAEFRPTSERRQDKTQSRAPSRPQTMAYSNGHSDTFDFSGDPSEEQYGRQAKRTREVQAAAPRKDNYSRRGSAAAPSKEQNTPRYRPSPEDYPPTKQQQPLGPSYPPHPSESQTSLQNRQQFQPIYPPGFGSEDQVNQQRPPAQQGRPGRGPAVLTKDRRRFADAYEQEPEPGAGGGHHAGSTGAAKRVMDFFRRRGKARTGNDQI